MSTSCLERARLRTSAGYRLYSIHDHGSQVQWKTTSENIEVAWPSTDSVSQEYFSAGTKITKQCMLSYKQQRWWINLDWKRSSQLHKTTQENRFNDLLKNLSRVYLDLPPLDLLPSVTTFPVLGNQNWARGFKCGHKCQMRRILICWLCSC